jgi:Flp pilus assembly protein TadD
MQVLHPVVPQLALAACCAACAVWLAVHAADARTVHRANDLGLRGSHVQALATARDVTRRPSAVRAARVRAAASVALGRLADAERALADVAADAPNDWEAHRGRAVVLRELGQPEAAQRAMARALELNPRLQLPFGFEAASGA